MKLRNKLLPLAGVAALAATVAPLALTSCGPTIQLTDITKGYQPTIDKHEEDLLGQNSANAAYLKDVKENNEIFKQDFLYGTYARFNSMFNRTYSTQYSSAVYKIKSLKAGASTPTFSMVNISYPGEPDVQYPTISLDTKYEMELTIEYMSQTTTSVYQGFDIKMSASVSYKNVPFYAKPASYKAGSKAAAQAYWLFGMADWEDDMYVYQWDTQPWSIDYDCDATMDIVSVVVGNDSVEQTIEAKQADTISSYSKLYDFVSQYSDAYGTLFGSGLDTWYRDGDFESIYALGFFLPIEFTSLFYGSYYMNNVMQAPEFYSKGNAIMPSVDITTTTDTTILGTMTSDNVCHYLLSMPTAVYQMYSTDPIVEKYEIYADIVDGEAKGKVTIPCVEGDSDAILTITEGRALPDTSLPVDSTTTYFPIPCTSDTAITTAGTYKFKLPKYIVVKPVIDEEYEIELEPQKVYLNQDYITLTITK